MAEDKYYDEIVEVKMPRKYALKLKAILSRNPDADVEEVKHGKWLDVIADNIGGVRISGLVGYKCSLCGREEISKEPYCNCGAKMDGKGDAK